MKKEHYAIVDSDRNVFVFGKNDEGQLGIGSKQDQQLPVKIENLSSIVATTFGNKFTLFLDDEGFVWVSGKLWRSPETIIPQKIADVFNIYKISSGENHCLLLDNNGNVFSIESNWSGQLGRDLDQDLVDQSVAKIENIPKIKNFCCGVFHSILIDVEGNCYSCGANQYGQLGLVNKNCRSEPTKIEGLPPIQSASAGSHHTILVAKDGRAYGFGLNCYDQLGFNSSGKNVVVPTQIKIREHEDAGVIKNAYCNRLSTILQDVDDNFWVCGGNAYGELGLGHDRMVGVPMKITTLPDIISVLSFPNSNIFINVNGECFASGYINNQMIPTKMEVPAQALVFQEKRFNKTKNARKHL